MGIATLQTLSVVGEGLSAQRERMNVAAENLAHAETTRTPDGGPYRRQRVVIEAAPQSRGFADALDSAQLSMRRTRAGHRAGATAATSSSATASDQSLKTDIVRSPEDDVKMVYDPSHPDANADGYVAMPDVDVITEMVELMSASRAYEANLTAAEAVKTMVDRALDI